MSFALSLANICAGCLPLNWRFDLASVYFETAAKGGSFELFKNAFPVT
jgi:hypothetical protein